MTEKSSEEFTPTTDAAEGRGGRMSEMKFAEHPTSIGANMTPEMRKRANKNRREWDAYWTSLEQWYRSGCVSLPGDDD